MLMKLNNIELYNELKQMGVSYLYHANTLTTSLEFIRNGGLYSRGEMERRALSQTEQISDAKDKAVNVWNDVFLDTIDLHGHIYSYCTRQNLYGPILFVLRIELLLDADYDNIWITTDNPVDWESTNEAENYFHDVETFIGSIRENRQKKMVTIRGLSSAVSFKKYLSRILIDDPGRKFAETRIYDYTFEKITTAVAQAELCCTIERHLCCGMCYCITNYKNMPTSILEKLFKDLTETEDN